MTPVEPLPPALAGTPRRSHTGADYPGVARPMRMVALLHLTASEAQQIRAKREHIGGSLHLAP